IFSNSSRAAVSPRTLSGDQPSSNAALYSGRNSSAGVTSSSFIAGHSIRAAVLLIEVAYRPVAALRLWYWRKNLARCPPLAAAGPVDRAKITKPRPRSAGPDKERDTYVSAQRPPLARRGGSFLGANRSLRRDTC